jgi:hypothetical protein
MVLLTQRIRRNLFEVAVGQLFSVRLIYQRVGGGILDADDAPFGSQYRVMMSSCFMNDYWVIKPIIR